MTNSTRALVRLLVIAIGLLVVIPLVMPLFLMFVFMFVSLLLAAFPPVMLNICFPAAALVIILACMRRFYLYLVDKVDAAWGETGRVRLRLAFAALALLVVLAFAFSEYSKHQQRQVIADICVQFSRARAQGEYEAAYELLSPNYRQTYSLEEFIADGGSGLGGCNRDGMHVVISGWGGEASITQRSFGTIYTVTHFEKVGGQWYFKGDMSAYQF